MAKIVTDPRTLPERELPIHGAKPPAYSLPYQDPGHREEVGFGSPNILPQPTTVAVKPPLQSFGVGTCVYLDQPLGSKFRLVFAAVASDRPPDGLQTDLSTVFRVIERVRCIVAEEREVVSVYVPLLGAGKGGVAAEIAFHTLLGALLEARCKGGGHHLREVHLVVHAPEGRPPQLAPERPEYHVDQLVTLYQATSQ